MEDNRSGLVTEALYETDSYIRTFDAKVLECIDTDSGLAIVLDRTAFFPEGGGQASDVGFLYAENKKFNVRDVQLVDGKILHYIDDANITLDRLALVQACVTGEIDWKLRFRRMQKHSAEHLFCGLIHNEFGYDNVGFHLGDDAVTLDVNGELTKEDIARIERRANEVVYENVTINISYPEASELERMDYRSKLELTDGVRLVTIEGYDVCACCAPHVRTTGEIGVIKIIDFMPHRGGTRLTLLAGIEAYDDYVMLDNSNRNIMAVVSSKRSESDSFVTAMDEKCKKLSAENTALKKQLAKMHLDNIKAELEKRESNNESPFLIFSDVLDDVQLRTIINDCRKERNIMVAGFMGNDASGYRYIIASEPDGEMELPVIAKMLNSALDGRGGGSKQMIQGSVKAKEQAIRDFIKGLSL